MMPVPPPRPSVCTCTTLGLTRSKMAVSAAENASGSGNDEVAVKLLVVCVMFFCTCSLFALTNGNLKRLQGIAANDFDGNRLAHAVADQEQLQFLCVVDLVAIECDQDIAEQNATLLSRAVIIDLYDEQAVFLIASGTLSNWNFYKLAADAQVAALDIPLFGQCVGNTRGNLHRDRQRNTVRQASCQNTSNLALCIDKRAAREAGIGSCVGA